MLGILSGSSGNFPQPVTFYTHFLAYFFIKIEDILFGFCGGKKLENSRINKKRNASQLMHKKQEVPHVAGKELSLKHSMIFYETAFDLGKDMFEMPFEMYLTGSLGFF